MTLLKTDIAKGITTLKKQILFFLISCSTILYYYGQKTVNKYSIELNMGLIQKKDSSTLSPNLYFNSELAGRYMFNVNHGIKLDIGLIPLSRDFNFNSFNKSFQIRYSAQYILNFGRLFHFEKFAPRFSGLMHLGGGISALKYKQSLYFRNWKTNLTDETINFILGITPQYKVNDRLEIHFDFSYNPEIFQESNQGFHWSDFTSESILGRKASFSFGGMYYIGKDKKHSDWDFKSKVIEKRYDSIPKKVDSLIVVIYDLDKDGILDSLDFCPEEFGLKEFGGCPKPELVFNCQLNDYPVFEFKGARYKIQEMYKPYIDSIAECLAKDKSKKILIYGHANVSGDSTFTGELSLNRAKEIKKALVEKGIEAERIFAIGEGTKKANIPKKEFDRIKNNRVAYFKTISKNQYDIRVLETNEYLQGLFFTVQIGAFHKIIKNNKFNKFGQVLIANSSDGFVKYSIGVFPNYEEAYSKLRELKNNGLFQDAFIAPYFLGEHITVKQAKELLDNKDNDILEPIK